MLTFAFRSGFKRISQGPTRCQALNQALPTFSFFQSEAECISSFNKGRPKSQWDEMHGWGCELVGDGVEARTRSTAFFSHHSYNFLIILLFSFTPAWPPLVSIGL